MEQREEERARGVDTLDKAEHFIVNGSSARFHMCFGSIEAWQHLTTPLWIPTEGNCLTSIAEILHLSKARNQSCWK